MMADLGLSPQAPFVTGRPALIPAPVLPQVAALPPDQPAPVGGERLGQRRLSAIGLPGLGLFVPDRPGRDWGIF